MAVANPVRDRNRDFLCTYGYAVYYDQHPHNSSTSWQHYAVPIKGKGASVREIIVTDEPYSQTRSPDFNVGIYTSASGVPGSFIVGGIGKAKGSCHRTKVAIPKTFLKAGKKYWVVEWVGRYAPHHSRGPYVHPSEVYWGYKSNEKRRNALYQRFSSSYFSSSLSDWLPVGGPQPFVNVR